MISRTTTIAVLILSLPIIAAAQWNPPIGIPAPDFGIEETVASVYGSASFFTHYVDRDHPSSTDSSNPFGTPSRPRNTIPSSLSAGSVVIVAGTYDYTTAGFTAINGSGTASNPVFVRGADASNKPRFTFATQFKGQYIIVENIEFDGGNPLFTQGAPHHIALRHCNIHDCGGPAIQVSAWDNQTMSNIVLYDIESHDNGNLQANFDEDYHGVGVGDYINNLWIVDSKFYRNSGDGIQINAGNRSAETTTHHIYVGRNESYQNKQTGMWSKQATDVVFSENIVYNHRPSNSSLGAGMGCQYDPERIWFLNNRIFDCDYGIMIASGSGLGSGRDLYIIGNVIYNIQDSNGDFNPSTSWSNAAIMVAGGYERYIVNNSIYNADGGIHGAAAFGEFHLANNIVSTITQSSGWHIFVEHPDPASSSTVDDCLFYQGGGNTRFDWSGTIYSGTGSFQSGAGAGAGNFESNPSFVNPNSGDLHIQSSSPAIDAGASHSVYSTFASLYGLNINIDIDGASRPGGAAYDIGADELGGGAPPPPPVGCTGNSQCNDGIDCTDDFCVGGDCINNAIDANCDDGQFCNGAETCDVFSGCVFGQGPCSGLTCDESANQCVTCTSDSECDDGSFCTGAERCISGECEAGVDPCPTQVCSEQGNACVDCFDHDECDNGLFCDGSELCVSGACEPGSAPCGVEQCNEDSQTCGALPDALINVGDVWCYQKGYAGTPAEDWATTLCQGSNWPTGPTGLGYGDGDDQTVLNDMSGSYITVYTKREFKVPQASQATRLILEIDYDDGFVAYLNGEEVARRNLGVQFSPVNRNTEASGLREAGTPEFIDLPLSKLVSSGTNVLAIEIHNFNISSSDLSFVPRLIAQTEDFVCVNDFECGNGKYCDGVETCEDGSCTDGTPQCPGQGCNDFTQACFDLPQPPPPPPAPSPGSCTDCESDAESGDPNTGAEILVGAQFDSDSDNVPDIFDRCQNTPANRAVDASGCTAQQRQLDDDNDGIVNIDDECSMTPPRTPVYQDGCSDAQLAAIGKPVTQPPAAPNRTTGAAQPDSDGDGVPDDNDECPESPTAAVVDETGCQVAIGGDEMANGCGGGGACGAIGMTSLVFVLLGLAGTRSRRYRS
ncbi:MAG: right-handed parallel beta-helix repeat-containing protein [Planctomycetes bacterium]|nr:right-handed parallel beta-helix repeat-containing protein [Planctomycetota bacterium]